MDDAGDGQHRRAGSVAVLWVASIAGHAADEAVQFRGPNRGLESEAALIGDALTVVGKVLRDGVRGSGAAEGHCEQQARHQNLVTCWHNLIIISLKNSSVE